MLNAWPLMLAALYKLSMLHINSSLVYHVLKDALSRSKEDIQFCMGYGETIHVGDMQ